MGEVLYCDYAWREKEKKDLGWLRKEIKKDKKGWLGRTKRLNGLRL